MRRRAAELHSRLSVLEQQIGELQIHFESEQAAWRSDSEPRLDDAAGRLAELECSVNALLVILQAGRHG